MAQEWPWDTGWEQRWLTTTPGVWVGGSGGSQPLLGTARVAVVACNHSWLAITPGIWKGGGRGPQLLLDSKRETAETHGHSLGLGGRRWGPVTILGSGWVTFYFKHLKLFFLFEYMYVCTNKPVQAFEQNVKN